MSLSLFEVGECGMKHFAGKRVEQALQLILSCMARNLLLFCVCPADLNWIHVLTDGQVAEPMFALLCHLVSGCYVAAD